MCRTCEKPRLKRKKWASARQRQRQCRENFAAATVETEQGEVSDWLKVVA